MVTIALLNTKLDLLPLTNAPHTIPFILPFAGKLDFPSFIMSPVYFCTTIMYFFRRSSIPYSILKCLPIPYQQLLLIFYGQEGKINTSANSCHAKEIMHEMVSNKSNIELNGKRVDNTVYKKPVQLLSTLTGRHENRVRYLHHFNGHSIHKGKWRLHYCGAQQQPNFVGN